MWLRWLRQLFSGPNDPTSVVGLLKQVAGTGESVELVYNGGTRPGLARRVAPISVNSRQLIGMDSPLAPNKTYRLDRIVSVRLDDGRFAENRHVEPRKASIPTAPARDDAVLTRLNEYVEMHGQSLRNAGWHLHLSEHEFGVGAVFKNGKPKKTPSIVVRYFGVGSTLIDPRDVGRTSRPWRVDSWRFTQGKSVASLPEAMALFLAEAEASDPKSAKPAFGHNQP